MHTRKYPRTLDEAFPHGAHYGAAITRPRTFAERNRRGERLAGRVLAVVIGVCLAAALVNWWAS